MQGYGLSAAGHLRVNRRCPGHTQRVGSVTGRAGEVKRYVRGYYGKPPAPNDRAAAQAISASGRSCRPADMLDPGWRTRRESCALRKMYCRARCFHRSPSVPRAAGQGLGGRRSCRCDRPGCSHSRPRRHQVTAPAGPNFRLGRSQASRRPGWVAAMAQLTLELRGVPYEIEAASDLIIVNGWPGPPTCRQLSRSTWGQPAHGRSQVASPRSAVASRSKPRARAAGQAAAQAPRYLSPASAITHLGLVIKVLKQEGDGFNPARSRGARAMKMQNELHAKRGRSSGSWSGRRLRRDAPSSSSDPGASRCCSPGYRRPSGGCGSTSLERRQVRALRG